MPTFVFTSPDGKEFEVDGPEGATNEEAFRVLQSQLGSGINPNQAPIGASRYAAEDSAQEQANKQANVFQQFGRGAKAQMGRFALGATELANNLTGDRLIDPEVLATAQHGADTMDRGTGTAGFVGNVAGDPLTWALGGVGGAGIKSAKTTTQAVKAASKAGAATGAVSGAIQSTGNSDSDILTNLKNSAIGTAMGGTIGAVVPAGVSGVKGVGRVTGNLAQRVAAGFGSEAAANNVAYKNIAKILTEQVYHPSEVASVIDGYKAQGIKGGTLGQMLESSDLLAREKNLIQGGGRAGRVMQENLRAQPDLVSDSINKKIGEIYQPETTSYLYNKASEFGSIPSLDEKMGAVTQRGITAADKYLAPAVDSVEAYLNQVKSEIPESAYNYVSNTIAKMRNGEIGVDEGKQIIRDLYSDANPSSLSFEQKSLNRVSTKISSDLNTALETSGGEPYAAAKIAAEGDRVVRSALEAFDTTNVGNLKTALNKFYGSPEKQREFLDKLPNEAVRKEFKAYLDNLQKVAGKFGGSDTASNQATGRAMNAESGFGIEGDISARGLLQKLSNPIAKNVRKAQAEITFNPDTQTLQNAMTKRAYNADTLTRAVPQVVNRANQGLSQNDRRNIKSSAPSINIQMEPMSYVAPQSNNQQYFDSIKQAESGGNPNAQAKTSSASGLYQFTDKTWKDSVAKWGKKYGITEAMKNNPQAQEVMVRELAADNARILTNKLKREPNIADMYVAHVFGAGDGAKLINNIGTNKPALMIMPPRVVNANKSIFFDGRKPRTVEQVYSLLGNKVT